MPEDFEFLVIIEVDDLDALKGYLAHPSHAAFGAHFTQSSPRRWPTTTRSSMWRMRSSWWVGD